MPDPLDRLTVAKAKIDELFGADYAREHPEVLVVVVQSAASDEPEAPQPLYRCAGCCGAHMTGILTALSVGTAVLFVVLMVVALVEAADVYGRRR